MIDYRKAMLRGLVATGFLLGVGSAAFAQATPTATPTATASTSPSPTPSSKPTTSASTSSLKVVTAVGTLTVTPATSCINVTCPGSDTCTSEVLTGTSKNFNRFGGFKSNSQLILCETIDTTVLSTLTGNGCTPASGIGTLTSGTNTLVFNLAGQACPLPGTTTGLEAFNQVGAITGSTSSKITSGGGSFNSWDNGSTGSFNLSANYSK